MHYNYLIYSEIVTFFSIDKCSNSMLESYIDGGIEGNPEIVGMSSSGLDEVINLLKKQVKEKLHSGTQLHIAREGQTVLNIAIGEARPGVPMKRNTVMHLYSAGKPWTALAIAQLYEQGKLDIYQPIQTIIPEFVNGKESCTIEHVLIHEGGFPMWKYPQDDTTNCEEWIRDICNEKAEYVPGTQCGYHHASGWVLLGEIVRIIDGRKIEKYIEDEIFTPLGLNDSSLGMTKNKAEQLGGRLALKDTSPDYIPWAHFYNLFGNNPDHVILPGGSSYSTATDLGKFYKALWNGGESSEGTRIIKKKTLNLFTATHRMGITDQILSLPNLGEFDLRPSYGYGFFKGKALGLMCSPDTFGHGGMRSSVNFCDPKIDLIINFNSNTLLNVEPVFKRANDIKSAIYNTCRYKF